MSSTDLFTPIDLGPMTVHGRLLRSGTSESGSSEQGVPSNALGQMYVELARGGCPLVLTGFAYVRADGKSGSLQNAIHLDRLVPHWRSITDAVHRANPECRIGMQVVHGGRQCKPEGTPTTMAPSAVPDRRFGQTPREMTENEIVDCIEAFGQAARRVKEAGFDAVQLHGAHGYLIAQFNSPHTNRRSDAWGGSPEARMKFLREVLERTRTEVGDDFPILIKLNATDCIDGGLTPEGSAEICNALIRDGIDGIELSAWMAEADPSKAPSREVDPSPEQEGYYLDACRVIRKKVECGSVPLGPCGGFRSLEVMNAMIRDDGFDFVSASRPFICEPDVFRRLEAGQPRSGCNSCNECINGDRIPVVNCPPVIEGRLETPYLERRIGPQFID
ncbi:MAG: NADH:flavin oxidoreductase [Planctomycetota bacterium]